MHRARWQYYAAAGGAGFLLVRPLLLPGRIVSVARGELGNGNDPKYGTATNWCAIFAGWAVERAAHSLLFSTPDWRYENGKPVAGAKRLVERAAEAGTWIAKDGVLLSTPLPGDLASFDRGPEGSWYGHVAIVTGYHDGVLDMVSGNAGSPSRVRESSGKLSNLRLEAIARPHFSNPVIVNVALTAGASYGAYRLLRR